jgi:hypothetical protein
MGSPGWIFVIMGIILLVRGSFFGWFMIFVGIGFVAIHAYYIRKRNKSNRSKDDE